ncbi:MAG: hypothetical protein GQ570_08290 [Helicobacteraceae bacterium]|nr:hypothetical protein [Helicobacteraceae bacterium]
MNSAILKFFILLYLFMQTATAVDFIGKYTVVLCSTQNLENTKAFIKSKIDKANTDIYIFKNKNRFLTTFGSFDSQEHAKEFKKSLPPTLQELNPYVFTFDKILLPAQNPSTDAPKYSLAISNLQNLKNADDFLQQNLPSPIANIYVFKTRENRFITTYGSFNSADEASAFRSKLPPALLAKNPYAKQIIGSKQITALVQVFPFIQPNDNKLVKILRFKYKKERNLRKKPIRRSQPTRAMQPKPTPTTLKRTVIPIIANTTPQAPVVNRVQQVTKKEQIILAKPVQQSEVITITKVKPQVDNQLFTIKIKRKNKAIETKLAKKDSKIKFKLALAYTPMSLDSSFSYGTNNPVISTKNTLGLNSESGVLIPTFAISKADHSIYLTYIGNNYSATKTNTTAFTLMNQSYAVGDQISSLVDTKWFNLGYKYTIGNFKVGAGYHMYSQSFKITSATANTDINANYNFLSTSVDYNYDVKYVMLNIGLKYGTDMSDLGYYDYYLSVSKYLEELYGSTISFGFAQQHFNLVDTNYKGDIDYAGFYLKISKEF